MKIFNIFKKKEAKSQGFRRQSFIDYLLCNKQYDLAAQQAINYYSNCAPLYTAINWIAQEGSSINIKLFDPKKDSFIDKHPVLDLLAAPNADSTYEEFMYALITFLQLTGNSYLVADGPVNRPPISIHNTPPQSLSWTMADDGYPKSFQVSSVNDSHTFLRKIVNSRFRYYEQDMRELWQIKTFNPDTTNFKIVGKSPLNSIYYEIEQYLSSSIHNLSLLKRGSTINGIFKHGNKLTDDSYRRLQSQIDMFFSGENNAGRTFLAEDGLDFIPTSQSNKDMDFLELKKNVTETIYNLFRIPLPSVSAETMTLANMDAAKLDLYDNAVTPAINRIYAELTNFLLSRYPNTEGMYFTYDPSEILALESRKNENLKFLQSLNILTTNELRRLVGYENLDAGGDSLYQPAANIPFAKDVNVESIDKN